MKFSELHQLLQEKLGIDHLADLARELGVSPQAVSNWKARDRVPYKYVLKIRKQLKVSDTQAIDQRENNVTDSNQVFTQNKYPHYYDEDTISVSDILLVIAGQLKIIIITPLILCTITFFNILFNTTPVFKSSAKIMASSSGGNSQTASGIAAQFGITLPTSQSEPQWVYPQIIKSRTLARAMLKRRFDTEKYGSQTPLLQILTYGDQKPTVGLDTLIKAGVDGVIAMIQIEERGSFYNLTISGFEPLFVRDFANALIEELDKHQRKYNKAKKSETRNFIEERIIDTRKELEIAEEDLKNFSNHRHYN